MPACDTQLPGAHVPSGTASRDPSSCPGIAHAPPAPPWDPLPKQTALRPAELHPEMQQPSRGHSLAAPHRPGPEAPPSSPDTPAIRRQRPRSSGARAAQLRLLPATQVPGMAARCLPWVQPRVLRPLGDPSHFPTSRTPKDPCCPFASATHPPPKPHPGPCPHPEMRCLQILDSISGPREPVSGPSGSLSLAPLSRPGKARAHPAQPLGPPGPGGHASHLLHGTPGQQVN